MEVSVLESSGIPEGCLLSVRAGNSRRQAPVPLVEPLRFPSLPFNAKHFKIDVLKSVASARLDIDAQTSVESYSVALDLGEMGQAEVGFSIREEPSLCGKRAAELKEIDRKLRNPSAYPSAALAEPKMREESKSAPDVQEYAKEHNIPNFVKELLQHVLHERPAAPYSVMATFFKKKAEDRGEEAPAEVGRAVPAPVPAPLLSKAEVSHGGQGTYNASRMEAPVPVPPPDLGNQGGGGGGSNDGGQSVLAPASSRQLQDAGAALADPERFRLEAEYMWLTAERAVLLQEMAELGSCPPALRS